jgi:hypothetical protein
MISWHRLFGITLTDFFTDTGYSVELEKDLSLQQQLLDVVIIEKEDGPPPAELPDGLEDMSRHNLMTYKSHQQALDGWALDELTGHFVNYRKSVGSQGDRLPPLNQFRLYAVSARYPAKLGRSVDLEKKKEGVYDVRWGIRNIRVIVLSRISLDGKNAIWHLFSADPEKVAAGFSGYHWRGSPSLAINELFRAYQLEGIIAMPYTMEDFQKDAVREQLKRMSPGEILENISVESLLKEMSEEELVQVLELIKRKLSSSGRNKNVNFPRDDVPGE